MPVSLTDKHHLSDSELLLRLFKVAGDRIFISMHLCKEYARSATTNTDNTRNIYEKVL